MNLDPSLREFQETRMRGKTFILDTDFVLRSIIREHPRHSAYLALVQKLNDLEHKSTLSFRGRMLTLLMIIMGSSKNLMLWCMGFIT